jgi:heterodisulfide reductase subunit A
VEQLDQDGRVEERRHDLVVLAQGLVPAWRRDGMLDVEEAKDGFVATPDSRLNPSYTSLTGVFVGGVAAGPKDIPDSIVEAGEAAMAAAAHLHRARVRSGPGREGAPA